jgi:hypothetical protein
LSLVLEQAPQPPLPYAALRHSPSAWIFPSSGDDPEILLSCESAGGGGGTGKASAPNWIKKSKLKKKIISYINTKN